jgi:hypothetical protein
LTVTDAGLYLNSTMFTVADCTAAPVAAGVEVAPVVVVARIEPLLDEDESPQPAARAARARAAAATELL